MNQPEFRHRLVGFNLTGFMSMASMGHLNIDELDAIRHWGFNFVRIPLNYRHWISFSEPVQLYQDFLERIDRLVLAALERGLHVCLALHRAPGYTVSKEGAESGSLWKDEECSRRFEECWLRLAQRYQHVPDTDLSFNLVNEPGPADERMSREDYQRVMLQAAMAVRRISPSRRVIIDGLGWGQEPLVELAASGLWQSCRGYSPFALTHFGVRSSTQNDLPPTWPLVLKGKGILDKEWLLRRYRPWKKMTKLGVTVHCGEFGCSNITPHTHVLAWTRDLLSVLQECTIGFALWNLRGPFGILDSRRKDARYERTTYGLLDRELLTVMQEAR